MNEKIRLSHSTLNLLHTASHMWINKQMKLEQPDQVWFKEGREAHRIIQDHVSGSKRHDYLKDILVTFPIVERCDFDPRCKFTFSWNEKYELTGFVDGADWKNSRILEIKTSGKGAWSLQKYKDSVQRKLYGMALKVNEAYLITGSRKVEDWKTQPPKVYSLKFTPQDIEEVKVWVQEGIHILESGNFTGGLDENGRCTGCYWRENCHFT